MGHGDGETGGMSQSSSSPRSGERLLMKEVLLRSKMTVFRFSMAWELLLLIWDRGDPRSLCPDLRTYVRRPFIHQDFVICNKIRVFRRKSSRIFQIRRDCRHSSRLCRMAGEWGSLLASSLQGPVIFLVRI